ncbi:MAG: phosphatase PAP2 family protein [Sandarakinorhabdus sp.]|nr:phosphatase PAP2 family protein [Sandarakinorhabdus sp.]
MRRQMMVAGLAAVLAASPAAASDKFWQTYADIGAIGIPVAAGVYTLSQDDPNGMRQLALTTGSSVLAATALKYTINSTRPNGGDHSFPSGHTSLAFSGAGYLRVRYGWRVGLPFELLAATVGFARVQSHDHHWYDVVAGAAIGEGAAQIFTRRLDENVRVSVAGDTQGGIVSLSARF